MPTDMPTGHQPTTPGDGESDEGHAAPGTRRPGRPRALPLQEQRRLVIEAARAVFAREGYAGATVERVARAARTPRSSVYELFDSKKELFTAVVDDAAERLVSHLSASFRESQDYELHDYVRHNYACAFELFERDRDSVAVLLHAERAGVEPSTQVVGDTRQRVLGEIVGSAGARWSDLGLHEEVGAANEMLALMFLRLAEGVAGYQADRGGWDRDALIDLLTEFTLGGLYRLTRHVDVLRAASRRTTDQPVE